MKFWSFANRAPADSSSTKLGLDQLAYGGTWELFDSSQQLSAARGNTGMRDWTVAIGGKMLGRFGREPKGSHAAAAILAGLKDDAVAVEEVEAGYWVCAVSGGMPLPGGDQIMESREAAEAHAMAFVRYVPSAVRIGLVEGSTTTLAQVLLEVPLDAISRALLVQWRWRFARLIAALVAAAVLIAGGLSLQAYLERQEAQAEQAAPVQVAPPVQVVVDPSPQVVEPPVERSYAPLDALGVMTSAVNGIEARAGGYEPTSVNCDLSRDVCDVNWQGDLAATAEGAAMIPGLVNTPRDLIAGMPVLSRISVHPAESRPVTPSDEVAVLAMKAFFQRAQLTSLPIQASIRAAGPERYVVTVRASYAYAKDLARVVQSANGFTRAIRLENVNTNQPMIAFDADISLARVVPPRAAPPAGSAPAAAAASMPEGERKP